MGSHMDGSVLERFLVHILTPLYRIVDEETIKDAQMGKFIPVFLLYFLRILTL
jgi:hypothetical protein